LVSEDDATRHTENNSGPCLQAGPRKAWRTPARSAVKETPAGNGCPCPAGRGTRTPGQSVGRTVAHQLRSGAADIPASAVYDGVLALPVPSFKRSNYYRGERRSI